MSDVGGVSGSVCPPVCLCVFVCVDSSTSGASPGVKTPVLDTELVTKMSLWEVCVHAHRDAEGSHLNSVISCLHKIKVKKSSVSSG